MERPPWRPLWALCLLGIPTQVVMLPPPVPPPPPDKLPVSCRRPGHITNGFIYSYDEIHRNGSMISFSCLKGYRIIGPRASRCMTYEKYAKWNNTFPHCQQISCAAPPDILRGSHNGTGTYPYGTVIKYSCRSTWSLIGTPYISCDAAKEEAVWRGKLPICRVVVCGDPSIEHGITISRLEQSHTYGKQISFQCKNGYFMIGSYLVRCEADSTWVPKLPSCKKISPGFCGAPVIPSGKVEPLQPQYGIGKVIALRCNRNYSFFDETIIMKVRCQGYNLWNPPVQACFPRTSPDTSDLFIRNGMIVRGKKNYYEPGDKVIIKCHAGFVLEGLPNIQYIGGQKWLPVIPTCSLSIFLRLVIAACLLPVLMLGIKIAYQKYLERSTTSHINNMEIISMKRKVYAILSEVQLNKHMQRSMTACTVTISVIYTVTVVIQIFQKLMSRS